MQIKYKFTSDAEPTDEQLHLLMQEVAIEAKIKAEKAHNLFWKQLDKEVALAKKRWATLNLRKK